MIASVSSAARDNFFGSTTSRASSHARSLAVRKAHFPATRTRLTPRGLYSACNCRRAVRTSTLSGSRLESVASSSGSAAANSRASNNRSSSGRVRASSVASSAGSGDAIFKCLSATAVMEMASLLLNARAAGRRAVTRFFILVHRTLAQIDRPERAVLMYVDDTLAHHFERRRETRCERGRPHRGLDHVGDEVIGEPTPVVPGAEQPLERLTRLRERPDDARHKAHTRKRMLAPLSGIGGEQIVEGRRPLRMLHRCNRLRHAAAENVATELRARRQRIGDCAESLEA